MTFDERRLFVDVYYKATTDPYYKDAFNNLLMKHSRIPTDLLHHASEIFLPWHRWFTLKIENFLRQIDCRVTLPYYQWTARVDDGTVLRTTDPIDVWYGGPQGIGGNGVKPSSCVQDGKFKEGNWHIPIVKGGGCLKRNFNYTFNLCNQKDINKLLNGSFTMFEYMAREIIFPQFRLCIGGLMSDDRYASCSPEFVLIYSFMDKLWDEFQKRNEKERFAYYTTVNFLMPFADIYGFEMLDNIHLPGGLAVEYEDFKYQPGKTSHQYTKRGELNDENRPQEDTD